MRAKDNFSIDSNVPHARVRGLSMARVAKSASAVSPRVEPNRLWREHHRATLEAYAREVERDGLALAPYRTF